MKIENLSSLAMDNLMGCVRKLNLPPHTILQLLLEDKQLNLYGLEAKSLNENERESRDTYLQERGKK